MDSDDTLLFVCDMGKLTFREKTAELASLSFDKGKYQISYLNNPAKLYSYSPERIALCSYQEKIDGNDIKVISLRSGSPKPLNDIQEIRCYKSDNPSLDDRVNILFKNKNKYEPYARSELIFKRLASRYPVFRYLNEICKAIKPKGAADEIKEYLIKQFERLHTLDDTAAACFVDPIQCPQSRHQDITTVIFPFGSNLSQMQAIDNALNNQLSLIEGPPGTGKTQTILNILANLIIRDKNTLVASPNNAATRNVSDKLKELGFEFLVATLGNAENSKQFVGSQPEYPTTLSDWNYPESEVQEAKEFVKVRTPELKRAYQCQRELAQMKTELNEWEIEYQYFINGYGEVDSLGYRSWSTFEGMQELRDRVGAYASSEKSFGFLNRLRAIILEGVGTWNDYRMTAVDFEISLNRSLFERQIAFLKNEIAKQEVELKSSEVKKLIEEITANSLIVLKSHLWRKYSIQASRGIRKKFESPWEQADEFRKEYPILTSTTNAARNQMGKGRQLFDYIVIDESSQADLVTGMLALSSAENAVVVGDTKQLPCVITEQDKGLCEGVDDEFQPEECYRYIEQSLLSSLASNIQNGRLDAPKQLLKEHYRCHPKIIGFCNKMFYRNELIIMTEGDHLDEVMFTADMNDYNYDRECDYNRIQAGFFKDDILPFFEEYQEREQIAVVTPYRRQADGMQLDQSFLGIEIDTVHKFQGREKDAVAFITRVNGINEFINNPNLINVAVSRAKSQLALIAAPNITRGSNNIADLDRYIKYNDGKVVVSSVSSSFDLIYPSNREKQRVYLKKKRANPGAYYSEVQVKEWIDEAIRELECETQLGYLQNYPLRQFLIELEPFSQEEQRFIKTVAHTDFLFYRKSDKSVLFALEVNGCRHDLPSQMKRDKTKASILSKASISLDILRTNEYNPAKGIFELISRYYNEEENKDAIYVAVNNEENPWEQLSGDNATSFSRQGNRY